METGQHGEVMYLVAVKFIESYPYLPQYAVGETARFKADAAKFLIERGFATSAETQSQARRRELRERLERLEAEGLPCGLPPPTVSLTGASTQEWFSDLWRRRAESLVLLARQLRDAAPALAPAKKKAAHAPVQFDPTEFDAELRCVRADPALRGDLSERQYMQKCALKLRNKDGRQASKSWADKRLRELRANGNM
jgi:hypothetical protein